MLSNHLTLCLSLLLLPSIFPSIRVFFNELAFCIRWPKYWSFSFSFSSFNKYLGLVFFRMDWLIYLQSKGFSRVFSNTTASILQCSAFLMVQLSHPYMTTGKTLALTVHTSVGKVKGYLLLVGSNILLSIISQQLVAILEFLQEKMSTHPSTPPS